MVSGSYIVPQGRSEVLRVRSSSKRGVGVLGGGGGGVEAGHR